MSLREIPSVRIGLDHKEFKKNHIKKLCEGYNDIIGRKINMETMHTIFHYARLFDEYKISPLLFFSYCITGYPRDEYVRNFSLKNITTEALLTMPISLMNAVEHTIAEMGYIPRAINIEFDPFDLEWKNPIEYDAFMNHFIENKLDDIRYKWFLTIQFY